MRPPARSWCGVRGGWTADASADFGSSNAYVERIDVAYVVAADFGVFGCCADGVDDRRSCSQSLTDDGVEVILVAVGEVVMEAFRDFRMPSEPLQRPCHRTAAGLVADDQKRAQPFEQCRRLAQRGIVKQQVERRNGRPIAAVVDDIEQKLVERGAATIVGRG